MNIKSVLLLCKSLNSFKNMADCLLFGLMIMCDVFIGKNKNKQPEYWGTNEITEN